MRRRRFLTIGGSAGIASLAGCSDDSGVKDSDGDGLIDSQDYAPKDPDVQQKADLSTSIGKTETPTETPSATATATQTSTPTARPTDTATATTTETANSIRVRSENRPQILSHFTEYSVEGASVS